MLHKSKEMRLYMNAFAKSRLAKKENKEKESQRASASTTVIIFALAVDKILLKDIFDTNHLPKCYYFN